MSRQATHGFRILTTGTCCGPIHKGTCTRLAMASQGRCSFKSHIIDIQSTSAGAEIVFVITHGVRIRTLPSQQPSTTCAAKG